MFTMLRRLLHHISPRTIGRSTTPNRRATLRVEILEERLCRSVTPMQDTWTGAGVALGQGDGWLNPQNWASKVAPNPGDILIFESKPAALDSNNDFAVGMKFTSITINGSGYDITGNAVTLTAANALSAANPTGINTFELPLTLSGNQIITDANGSSNLILTKTVDNAGYTLTANSAGNLTFQGPIIGKGGLVAEGGAKIVLADTNAYTGITTVDGITLYLDAPNAIVGNVVIGNNDGPTREADVLRSSGDNEIAATSTVTINDNGLLSLNGNNNTISLLTMNGGNVDTGTGALEVTGAITVNGAANNAVIAGNLALGSGIFTIQPGTAQQPAIGLDITAVIGNGSGTELTKQGDGAMQLDPQAGGISVPNAYTGQTVVSAGILKVASADALGTGSAVVNSSSVLEYINNSAGAFAANPLTLDGGEFLISGANTSLSAPITLSANTTIAVDAGITLDLTGQVTGPGGFTKIWAGELNLWGADSYAGPTVVQGGILALDNAHALSGAGTTVDGPATLELQPMSYTPAALTLAGNLLSNGSGTWAGPITVTGTPNVVVASGDTFTLSGAIKGPGGLTIGDANDPSADGSVVFTGVNSFQGTAEVSVGILTVTNANALSSMTKVDAGATLQLQGGSAGLIFGANETLKLNDFGMNGAGALQNVGGNNAWAGTISLASNTGIAAATGTALTIDGLIDDTGNVTFGALNNPGVNGTVLLNHANTYTGYTIVASGDVALDNQTALGAWTTGTTVRTGATLQFMGGAKGAINYDKEGLQVYGSLENVSGNNTLDMPIQMFNPVTVTCDAGSSLTDLVQWSNDGHMLTVNAQGNVDLFSLNGAGGLTKTGPGILTLSGSAANLYGGYQQDGSGSTYVNEGTLLLKKPVNVEAIGGASVTIAAGATLAGTGTIGTALSATNVINNGTLSPGWQGSAGTLDIDGNYQQSGDANLDIELLSAKAYDQVNVTGSCRFRWNP